jgi:hypothetical protein
MYLQLHAPHKVITVKTSRLPRYTCDEQLDYPTQACMGSVSQTSPFCAVCCKEGHTRDRGLVPTPHRHQDVGADPERPLGSTWHYETRANK